VPVAALWEDFQQLGREGQRQLRQLLIPGMVICQIQATGEFDGSVHPLNQQRLAVQSLA
jgi:4-alpha-glucanotransferase